MKTYVKNLLALSALILGLNLVSAGRVAAQTFTTLYTFTNGTDGGDPYGITLSGNTLYGVTVGDTSNATVFAINTNGTGFTTLHSLTASDGLYLLGALVLSGNTLYGTATYGGSSSNGTVFAVNTDGSGFTILHNFTTMSLVGSGPTVTNSDGADPFAGLILSGNTLYGTTAKGGTSGFGTVFSVNTDGSDFIVLHTFNDGGIGDSSASLVLSGNTLYGTARYGGTSGVGTVFALNTSGSGFTILHNFAGYPSDGSHPVSGLTLSGSTLYGTTADGGGSFYGTVFKLNTDGSDFTLLHSFTAGNDGALPDAGLTLSGNTLYGTAAYGGAFGYAGYGTVFSLNTDGSDFTILHSFTHGDDGGQPFATLILSGNTLYGTADEGGSSHYGTVFSLTLPSFCAPAILDIAQYAGVNITGSIGCTYEIDYTTNLNNPTWIPLLTNTLSGSPFLFIDTNVISGSRFYRAVTQ